MNIINIVSMVCAIKSVMSALCLGMVLGWATGQRAAAAPAETAPETLVSAIAEIEAAANTQDIEQVMALYSGAFQGPDGFSRTQYEATLREFWSQYSDLSYDIDLVSWEADGDALLAETLTTVQGQRDDNGRDLTLTATVRSRQRYEQGQIVSQEILSEESRLESGTTPPTVTIQLPESVTPGQRFTFDAIVQEPLGDRILLGRAFDEDVTSEDFLAPRPVNLEQLTAGGLFKVGKAPIKPEQRWISSVIIREDGIVIDTRRLQIGNQGL